MRLFLPALFEIGLPMGWLPDETLFSLCSRYHHASGNRLAAKTTRILFGDSRQGCAHDFPARLQHFVDVSDGLLGSASSIIYERTILPFYIKLANRNLAKKTIDAATKGSSALLKFQLGLLTSRFRANHPLKSCPTCMSLDAQIHGTAYWHREHQLPGIWLCRAHDTLLQASDLKATGVRRFHWILPSESDFVQLDHDLDSGGARTLADMVAAFVSSPESFDLAQLRRACQRRLRFLNLLKGRTERLDHRNAGLSYFTFLKSLAGLGQLEGLPHGGPTAATEIARLMRSPRSGTHPLRWLAFGAWLFESWRAWMMEIQSDADPVDAEPASRKTALRLDDPRIKAFFEVLNAGSSVSAAASRVGVTTATGMHWAARQGVSVARRPKVLKPELRSRLIRALQSGCDKKQAAQLGNVSVQTITNLLRTEPDLRPCWIQARFDREKSKNRRAWSKVWEENPNSGVKAARLAAPAAYAWLRRNDLQWLQAQIALAPKSLRTASARVAWDVRDLELADLVRRAALQIAETHPGRLIRLSHLTQVIPKLQAKVRRLDRLPVTQATIHRVLQPAVRSHPSAGVLPLLTSKERQTRRV